MAGSRGHTVAASLIDHFGGLGPALTASPEALAAAVPDTEIVQFLGVLDQVLTARLRREIEAGPLLDTSKALGDYLHLKMAHLRTEELRVLFLDCGNRLIADEVISRGSHGETPVFPREIVRRALELGAGALLLAHNHPSGDPNPSHADLTATRCVAEAAKALGIRLHDHLIIAGPGGTSLRALGFM